MIIDILHISLKDKGAGYGYHEDDDILMNDHHMILPLRLLPIEQDLPHAAGTEAPPGELERKDVITAII